ncbi:uncharacterized protein [Typha angustifolia]|uniref:uncharacterized protein n=1 Tax=Typha angustifolia TaxID=59011 RepID=UPI003C2C7EE0
MEFKSKSRSNAVAANNSRKRYYGLLLLLAVGAALLAVVLLHKMRERRVISLLLKERDQQILSLQFLLEKEKANSKEMKRKLEDMRAKSTLLKSQRMELDEKLTNSESTAAYLKSKQKELEAVLEDKENQIKQLEENAGEHSTDQITHLTELLKQKEGEIEELKQHLPKEEPHVANATSRDEPPEETSKEEPHVANANGSDNNQPEDLSREGTWVKLNTNLEEGTEVSGQENEKSFDDAKVGLMEVKEQTEEPKDEEITESTESNEDRKLSESENGTDNYIEKAETKDEDSEKPVNPADEQGHVMKSRYGKRTKNKHRKHKMVNGEEELEKQNNEGEQQIIEPVSTDNGVTESNNKEIKVIEASTIMAKEETIEETKEETKEETTLPTDESKHGSEENQEELLSRSRNEGDGVIQDRETENDTASDPEKADA